MQFLVGANSLVQQYFAPRQHNWEALY